MFLYLSEKNIISLPSFAQISCNMELPDAVDYGVAGLVTDEEGVIRLMVCSGKACYVRKDSEWDSNYPMQQFR